jgi:hypothetical protein
MKILVIGEGSVADEVRSFAAVRAINGLTYKGETWETEIELLPIHGGVVNIKQDIDVLIYSRPMSVGVLEEYRKTGTRIIIDQDDDFASIPPTHIAYKNIGPSSPTIAEHRRALALADYQIFSTDEIASRLATRPYTVIPNGWDEKNPNWNINTSFDGVVIGWGGTQTHREDFKQVVLPLHRILDEYPETRLHIAGDPVVYKMFRNIPEGRKMFFYWFNYEDYPIFLRQLDILIAPLINDAFNRAKSDIKLVEAGAAGVPWIASMVTPYLTWDIHSGVFATTEDEWYLRLKTLVEKKEIRERLGSQGRMHAQNRTFEILHPLWVNTIAHVMEMSNENLVPLQRQPEGVELQRVEGDGASPSNQQSKRRRHR